MSAPPSLMAREAAEAPAAVARMLERAGAPIAALARGFAAAPPPFVATCARGSSAHAATYGKYLIEGHAGVAVASVAPSLAAPIRAPGALCLAVSQSGRSPDLLASVGAYARGGATVAAMVNDEGSPLAGAASVIVPLAAGPERSVAATKSCLAAMAAFAALTAAWTGDPALDAAVAGLPALLDRALACDWGEGLEGLREARGLFVIGRGAAIGVAGEMALKLKETCAIQAEAFSAAEVRHGPMAIVGAGFPVLALCTADAAGAEVAAVADLFAGRGARVLRIGGAALPVPDAPSATQPLAMLARFYPAVERLARARGRDPDRPPHLAKVTETV